MAKHSSKKRAAMVVAVSRRRKKVKRMAIEHMGGKCVICGYSRCAAALEFHHKDQSQKDFAISNSGHCRSWDRVVAELEKCMMLCSNCHKELHAGELPCMALTRAA